MRRLLSTVALAASLLSTSASWAALQDYSIAVEFDPVFGKWKLTAATATALGVSSPAWFQPEGLGVAKAINKLDTSVVEYTCTALIDVSFNIRSGTHVYMPVFKLKKCAPTVP